MEENKKEQKKYLRYLLGDNIRAIIKAANDDGITKEEFLSLNKSEGSYILIYYR